MSETFFTYPDEKILDGVLAHFEKLAQIPRPSKHEEQVSNFLRNFFEQRALTVVQDNCRISSPKSPPLRAKKILR